MQHIEWTEELELGHPGIDAQHRRIVEILNSLHQAASAHRTGSAENALLDELVRLVDEHFRTEEAMMRAARFAGYETHREAHQILLQSVVDLRDSLFRQHENISLKTLNFLKRWLYDHMCHTDCDLKVIFDSPARRGHA
ncbi:MAG: hemerythrin family protein [Betaproteobacteria bacterium]|nr:hemerythrin family protein [Betaproteobacteria bacterium]